MESLLNKHFGTIVIHSGEGEEGVFEEYTGKRTARAIKSRLSRERCNGYRWAAAYIYLHGSDFGAVYMDLEDGELKHISEEDIA